MRRLIAVFAACLLVLAVAGPAAAARPDRGPLPSGDWSLAAGEACTFQVDFTTLAFSVKEIDFSDNAGNWTHGVMTGTDKVRATNHDTGASVDLNLSGPIHATAQPDGSIVVKAVGGGWWFWWVGQPTAGLWYSHGQATGIVDTAGNFTWVQFPTEMVNLCPILAG